MQLFVSHDDELNLCAPFSFIQNIPLGLPFSVLSVVSHSQDSNIYIKKSKIFPTREKHISFKKVYNYCMRISKTIFNNKRIPKLEVGRAEY